MASPERPEAISPPGVGFIKLDNVEVEEQSTFFVGASATGTALVHNGGGNDTAEDQPRRRAARLSPGAVTCVAK